MNKNKSEIKRRIDFFTNQGIKNPNFEFFVDTLKKYLKWEVYKYGDGKNKNSEFRNPFMFIDTSNYNQSVELRLFQQILICSGVETTTATSYNWEYSFPSDNKIAQCLVFCEPKPILFLPEALQAINILDCLLNCHLLEELVVLKNDDLDYLIFDQLIPKVNVSLEDQGVTVKAQVMY